MKRHTYIISIFLSLILIVSCKNKNNNNDTTESSVNNEPPTAFYKIMTDNNFKAVEFMSAYFDNIGTDEQITSIKEIVINSLKAAADNIEAELGIEGVEMGFRKVSYIYKSKDVNDNEIELSSAVLWRGYYVADKWYDLSPDNICLMEHYTITSDAECPSQSFPMELFITGNTLTIMPDYIGFGVTKNMTQPYLNHELYAENSVDALPAAYGLFKDNTSVSLNSSWELCVMGASQGGGNALAVHKYFDTNESLAGQWRFSYSFAAAGAHNPTITIQNYYETSKTALPVVLPMTIKSMLQSYPEILSDYNEDSFFSDEYLEHKNTIDQMLSSKEYTTTEITQYILGNVKHTYNDSLALDEIELSDILSEEMLDLESDMYKRLCQCLEKNELTLGWLPVRPIKLFYSKGDRIVTYNNSLAVLEAFGTDKVSVVEMTELAEHQQCCMSWMIKVMMEGI